MKKLNRTLGEIWPFFFLIGVPIILCFDLGATILSYLFLIGFPTAIIWEFIRPKSEIERLRRKAYQKQQLLYKQQKIEDQLRAIDS
jgi:hypothetical protein